MTSRTKAACELAADEFELVSGGNPSLPIEVRVSAAMEIVSDDSTQDLRAIVAPRGARPPNPR